MRNFNSTKRCSRWRTRRAEPSCNACRAGRCALLRWRSRLRCPSTQSRNTSGCWSARAWCGAAVQDASIFCRSTWSRSTKPPRGSRPSARSGPAGWIPSKRYCGPKIGYQPRLVEGDDRLDERWAEKASRQAEKTGRRIWGR